MIKIASPVSDNTFQSFKCGEIFCISPAVFNVTCCKCAVKMHLDQFACHFQIEHLALVEESINLEVLECKATVKSTNDGSMENINNKELDPADDPIKDADLGLANVKGSKILKQLLKKPRKAKQGIEKLSTESEVNDLNIGAKSEMEVLVEKSKTKNVKRSKRSKKCGDAKELKDPDADKPLEMTAKIETEENNSEDFASGDIEDKDWLEEEENAKTESETDNDIKDELPYPCHICKRFYRSKHGLKTHNQIAHHPHRKPPKYSKPELKCDQCSEVFRIARDLRRHIWKHTGIFCDICGKSFTQPSNMMRHKLRHTGVKDHKCKECGKDFFTEKELKSHMICHTKIMPVICEICGKQCRHRGGLKAHMRRHTGERPAKCDVCGKCFFSIHDLNVHAVSHTSERPFTCDICGSTFQRRKALRVHKLIHSKDRKHVCKICGKGFAQASGLKAHMRTHNAALDNPTVELVQQPPRNNELDKQPSTQVEDYSSGITTSTCKTDNVVGVVIPPENGVLEPYMN